MRFRVIAEIVQLLVLAGIGFRLQAKSGSKPMKHNHYLVPGVDLGARGGTLNIHGVLIPRPMAMQKITYCTICNTDFDGFGPRFIEENDTGNSFYSEPGPRLSDSRNNREVEFSRVAWALDGDIGDRSKQCLPSGQYA